MDDDMTGIQLIDDQSMPLSPDLQVQHASGFRTAEGEEDSRYNGPYKIGTPGKLPQVSESLHQNALL